MWSVTGWFHINWPLLPPPVLRWNSNSCSRVMNQTGKGSSWKEPLRIPWVNRHPCRTTLRMAQRWICLCWGCSWWKRTWNCSRRSRVFLLLPTGQVNSTGETAEAQVVEIFFVISVSLYSFQSCTKCSNDGYYVTVLFIYNPWSDFHNCSKLLFQPTSGHPSPSVYITEISKVL